MPVHSGLSSHAGTSEGTTGSLGPGRSHSISLALGAAWGAVGCRPGGPVAPAPELHK